VRARNDFERRANELGVINEYEADSKGRIYACYDNGEVLPTGLFLPALAGQTHIATGGLDQAIEEALNAGS
jgi:hypothetical protein